MPERIQRKRTKGWRMPPNTVSVCRPGAYGNPFTIKGAREAGYRGTDAELAQMCVDHFSAAWRDALSSYPYVPFERPVYLGPLIGKNLACWCKLGDPCHADVLLRIANSPAVTRPQREAP
jgi:hypothetical protein